MTAPHVLLITTDQQRYDTLHSVSPFMHTPNLEHLQSRGVTFERACTPNPVCVPARAAITTGLYLYTQWGATEELYDLAEDPHELVNRASDPGCRTLREALRGVLIDWCRTNDDATALDAHGDLKASAVDQMPVPAPLRSPLGCRPF